MKCLANQVSESPEAFQYMLGAFQKWNPKVTGMAPTEESVRDMLAVIDGLDESRSGLFVSHHGNEDWL